MSQSLVEFSYASRSCIRKRQNHRNPPPVRVFYVLASTFVGAFLFPVNHTAPTIREVEIMRMDQQPGNIVTQFFAWLAAIAGALGWTTQDVIYFAFGAIGVIISIVSFIYGRFDANKKRKEEEKRTRLLQNYLDEAKNKPADSRPSAVEVVAEALRKVDA
ncbi:hypothetical protein QX227_22890 [Pectobacterium aroidearum]|uniref:hypothetical protein n=2 Tax=Pectobacterium aroidearum TaxID=1201031 RepID=UPI002FC6CC01